jgi:leucyl aminopeptidase
MLHLTGFPKGPRRLLLVGMGAVSDRRASLRRAATLAARNAQRLGVGELVWYSGQITPEETESITIGLIAGSWEYADLKSPPPEAERKKPLEKASILTNNTDDTRRALRMVRRSGPAEPASIGDDARQSVYAGLSRRHGKGHRQALRDERDGPRSEGDGSGENGIFLAVAQGTPQEPKPMAIDKGGKPNAAGVLVGKGLCRTKRWHSIKPAQGWSLRSSICAGAGVLGTMEAIGQISLR